MMDVGWRAADLATAGVPLRCARAWARLRIQGSFVKSFGGEVPKCRLCEEGLETTAHVFMECARAHGIGAARALRHGIELPPRGPVCLNVIMGGSPLHAAPAMASVTRAVERACDRKRHSSQLGLQHKKGVRMFGNDEPSSGSDSTDDSTISAEDAIDDRGITAY